MAHLLLAEWDPELAAKVVALLESAGHSVTSLRSAAEVLPLLRKDPRRFAVVVLGMLQLPEADSFAVVKEMCRDPELAGLGKVLIFPVMADPRECEQMYGERGYVSFEPQVPRTLAVNQKNLAALNGAISVLLNRTDDKQRKPDPAA